MKDDNGKEWTKEDYKMAAISFIVIVILICIPAGILLLFNWFTKGKYYWYAWSAIFIGIFIFNIWLIFKDKHVSHP